MGSYDLSNKWYRFGAGQGLELNMFNCISKGSAYTIYMKVSLDSLNGWRRLISSAGWNENGVRLISSRFPNSTDVSELTMPGFADLCKIKVSDISRGRKLEVQGNYPGRL